ncbi:hypothetical protein GQ53DRAFT_879816 [Thozetella sp. PMI_491]|nr:hypothetical protein GQ53DRAFT_879816 [Thozetella sp. PMI_491]
MGNDAKRPSPGSNIEQAPRRKAKSGCGTCRNRKVKCDEGRPACQRCSTTGRICDGYGVWGGGNKPPSSTSPGDLSLVAQPPASRFLFSMSPEEKGCFEWFRYRAVGTLPGTFISNFWTDLVLQGSAAEPSVLHAVLALSSFHRARVLALSLQGMLFRHAYQHPFLRLLAVQPRILGHPFRDFNDAWRQLQWLLGKAFHLSEQSQGRRQGHDGSDSAASSLRAELERWIDAYKVSKKGLIGDGSRGEDRGYYVLPPYHIMADIIAATCLSLEDESIFDAHTDKFILLVKQSIKLRGVSHRSRRVQPIQGQGHLVDMANSIVDVGWIPPLYYTAVKCRVRRVRLHAMRLMLSSSHREGMWHGSYAATVARKVMEIEERDFYRHLKTTESFALSNVPRLQDLQLPPLPGSYRLRGVEPVLSGSPMDKILLFCKQIQNGADRRLCISEYSLLTDSWKETGCTFDSPMMLGA